MAKRLPIVPIIRKIAHYRDFVDVHLGHVTQGSSAVRFLYMHSASYRFYRLRGKYRGRDVRQGTDVRPMDVQIDELACLSGL